MNSAAWHLRFGWRAFKAQPSAFVKATLQLFVSWVILEIVVISVYRSLPGAQWVSLVLHSVFLVVFSLLLVREYLFAIAAASGAVLRVASLRSLMRPAVRLLIASGLYFAGVLAGLVLLIVPGVYFAVRFAAFAHLVVTTESAPFEAFRQAGMLARGRWVVLARFVSLVVLINVAGAALLGIGLVVTFPVTLIASASFFGSILQAQAVARESHALYPGNIEPGGYS